jgi:hypothetical protein
MMEDSMEGTTEVVMEDSVEGLTEGMMEGLEDFDFRNMAKVVLDNAP